jgi:hypothetical protein
VYEREDGVVRGAEGEEGVEQLERAWERCSTRTRQRAKHAALKLWQGHERAHSCQRGGGGGVDAGVQQVRSFSPAHTACAL